jgi:hypothetical protein
MLQQQVAAKIIFKVAHNGMNMISVILGVVVFYDNGRPLDAVVVRLSGSVLRAARPGEP